MVPLRLPVRHFAHNDSGRLRNRTGFTQREWAEWRPAGLSPRAIQVSTFDTPLEFGSVHRDHEPLMRHRIIDIAKPFGDGPREVIAFGRSTQRSRSLSMLDLGRR